MNTRVAGGPEKRVAEPPRRPAGQRLRPPRQPARQPSAPSRASTTACRNIHFRIIRPDDWHRLQLFHQRLSEASIRQRFHHAKPNLSSPFAHFFSDWDCHERVAVVATTGTRGRIVGDARFVRLDKHSAEVAFVVEDAFQGHGIGHHLMDHLAAEAAKYGITEFVAWVQPENEAMLRLLRETGPVRVRHEDGMDEVRLDLSGHHPARTLSMPH